MNRYTREYTDWNQLPLILNVAQVCQLLKKSKPTVLKLLGEGKIVGTKDGGCWYIAKSNVMKFLGVEVTG